METLVTCPACGEEASLDRKFDAWACFAIVGLAPNGQLMQAEELHTQVFDENEIECSRCGKKFDEQEVIDHLRNVRT
jgi:DNA-directed RNA polymerase subunit RPC12/RpoP